MSVSPTGQKIITKLRDRRQIDVALRRLLDASSELDLRRQVHALAAHGTQAIPSLVAGLDWADSRAVAAIGLVAAELDRDAAVDAFYRTLQEPGRSFAARNGAVTILERFLSAQVPDDLRPGVAETTAAAVTSLDTALDRSEKDPMVLVETVQELDQQEPDVVLAVVAALSAMEGTRPVELLRMLALDVRADIAAEAIAALGQRRSLEAARALQSVIPAAGAALAAGASRLLRKMQLSGVKTGPLSPASPAFRALAGPLDGEGQRPIWFLEETAGPGARVLVLVLSDEAGIVDAVEHRQVAKTSLPARRLPGTWFVALSGREDMALAEVTWDAARRLVAEAIELNHETQIPLPALLRLQAGWLWGGRPGPTQAPLLDPADGNDELVAESGVLAGHPAFAAWHPAREIVAAAADRILRHPAGDPHMWVQRFAAEMLAEPGAARRLARRLRANAQWLDMAGEPGLARTALATAGALNGERAAQLPFVVELVRRDLDAAVQWMRPSGRGRGPDREKGDR